MPTVPGNQNLDFLEDEDESQDTSLVAEGEESPEAQQGSGGRVSAPETGGQQQQQPQQQQEQDLSFLEDDAPETDDPDEGQDLSFLENADERDAVDENWNVLRELGRDPEKAAKAFKLSKETNLPYEVAWEQSTLVEDRVARPDTEKMRQYAPGTLKYLGQRENMEVSQDDHGILAKIEDTYHKSRQGWDVGRSNVEMGRLQSRQMMNVLAGKDKDPDLERKIDEMRSRRPERPEDATFGQSFFTSAAEQLPILGATIVGGQERGLEYASWGALTGAAMGQAGAPVTAPSGAAIGYGAGVKVGMAEEMFQLEGGLAFEEFSQMEDENGEPMDKEAAAAAATAVGAINAGLEFVGTRQFLRTIPGGEKLMGKLSRDRVKQALKNPSVRKSLSRVAGRYAGAVGMESLTEMAQESVQAIGQEALAEVAEQKEGQVFITPDTGQRLQSIYEAGVHAAKATATLGAPGAAVQGVSQARRAQKTKDYHDTVNRVYEASQESQTRIRSPEKFEEFLQTTGMGEEAFLDSDVVNEMFETDDAGTKTLFQELAIDPDTAREEAGQGRDVRVNTAKIYSRLEPEGFERVRSAIKPAPGAMSMRELESINPEEVLSDLADRYENMMQDEAEVQAQLDRVKKEVVQAGYDLEYARHHSRVLRSYADRLGMEGRSRSDFLKKIRVTGQKRQETGQDTEVRVPETGRRARDRVKAARERIQKDIRRTRAEHEGIETEAQSAIPQEIEGAINVMRGEIQSSESRGVARDEATGEAIPYGASSPQWMTRLQKQMQQAGESLFSRQEMLRLIEKMEKGEQLTERQQQRWQRLEEAANQVAGEHPDLVGESDAQYLEERGYAPTGNVSVPAAEFGPGDQIYGEIEGTEGEFVHLGIAQDGRAVFESIEAAEEGGVVEAAPRRIGIDMFDQIRVEGLKKWTPQAGETVYFDDVTGEAGREAGTFKQFRGNQAIIEYDGRETPVPRDNIHKAESDVVEETEGPAGEPGIEYYQSTYETAEPFYSELTSTVENMDFKSMPAKDLLSRIKKTQGIKQEEIDWTGLETWLSEQDGKVTKEQVLDYLAANTPEIEEVEKRQDRTSFRADPAEMVTSEISDSETRMQYADFGAVHAISQNQGETWTIYEQGVPVLTEGSRQDAESYILETVEEEHAENFTDETRYSEYQLSGGENYREMLITLPVKYREETRSIYDPRTGSFTTRGEIIEENKYRSSHWQEPNVLAHVRMNDRTGPNGERVLFLEEVQSDWHQEGRRKGYEGGVDRKAMAKEYLDSLPKDARPVAEKLLTAREEITGDRFVDDWFKLGRLAPNTDHNKIHDIRDEAESREKASVPDAPFKTTWPQLAMKRMVRYAAENGYDMVAWTPGEVQAERYNLSKRLSEVTAKKRPDSPGWDLRAKGPDGNEVLDVDVENDERLADHVGKDLADKIIADGGGAYTGLDLEVGGEGMKAFYDRILVNEVNKFFNKGKWGKAKVEQVSLQTEEGAAAGYPDFYEWVSARGDLVDPRTEWRDTGPLVDEFLKEKMQRENFARAHALPITDKMREKALAEGMPLFQRDKKGSITITSDQYIINVFDNADASTVIHETGHVFLEEMRGLIETGEASEQAQKDFKTLLRWMRVDSADQIGREQHEQFARGFERYLAEGRAPSRELESAFTRFKHWLNRIYTDLRQLDVTLTDSVRSVFDRMLADETQIRNAAIENDMEIMSKTEMDALGIVAEDRKYMERLLSEAKSKAEQAMVRDRERGKSWRRKQWRKQARETVDAMTEYQVIRELADGVGLDRRELIAMFGADIESAMPRTGMTRENGRSPEAVAAEHNYDSARQMIDAITEAPPKQEKINELAAQAEEQHDAQFTPEPYLADTAEFAEYLQIKSRYERRSVDKTARVTPARMFERFAQARMEQNQIRDAVRFDRFMSAMRRAVNEERKALQKNNLLDASEANETARLNYALANQAVRQRKVVENVIKKAKKAAKRKRGFFEHDYHENILGLISRYGLGTPAMRPQDPANKKPLRELVGVPRDPMLDTPPPWPEWLLSEQDNRSFKDLTVAEFRELANLLDHLAGEGRRRVKEDLAISEQNIEDLVTELIAPMQGLPSKKIWKENSRIGKAVRNAREFFAGLDMLIFIFRRLDGYTKVGRKGVAGPNERYLYNALAKAFSEKQKLLETVEQQLRPARNQLLKSMARHPKELRTNVKVPEIMQRKGRGWTFERVVAVALNMGNPDNQAKLMDGYGLTEQELADLTSILTREDWNAIQQIWDTIDSLWPQLNEVHYRLNHYYQKKIEAREFTAPTGQVLRGGYYPIKYDGSLSDIIAEWGEKEDLLNDTQAIYTKPAARDGHMMSRSGPGTKLPIKLSLGVLADHLDYAAQYITHAETVKDIDLIIRHKEYRRLVKEKLGDEVYEMIRPALKHVARPEREQKDVLSRSLEKHRMLATVHILGLNFSVAAKQVWSVPGYIYEEGFGTYMRGVASVVKNPAKARRTMRELSPYMRTRSQQVDRDMRRMLSRFSFSKDDTIAGVRREDVRDAMFIMIRAMDFAAVFPSWWGAFYKGQRLNNGDIEAAVRYADEAIASTQPSSRPMDMSFYQRSTKGLHRLFTMFSTFVLKYGNRQRYHFDGFKAGKISARDYMRHVLTESIIPPLGMGLMFGAIWGEWPEKEDLIWETVMYQFIGLPFYRDLVSAATGAVRDGFVSRVGDSPIFEGFKIGVDFAQALSKLVTELDDDERWKNAVWTFAVAFSYGMGVPAPRVYEKLVKGMEQWERGEGTPLNVLIPNYNKD